MDKFALGTREKSDSLIPSEMEIFPEMASISQISHALEDACVCTFVAQNNKPRFLFSSKMIEVIGSEASQDMLLSALLQHVCEEDRDNATRKYKEFFSQIDDEIFVDVARFEHSLMTEGIPLWIEVTMQRVRADGKTYVFGVMIDRTKTIFERMGSQLLLDGISEFIYYYDSISDTAYINKYTMDVLDLKNSRILNASYEFRRYIHPDDYSSFSLAFDNYMHKKAESVHVDFRLLAADGREIWVHSCGISSYDVAGCTCFFAGLLIDITDKMMHESLQQNIIDASSAVVFVANLARRTISFSENLHQILPDICLEYSGNVLEQISEHVLLDDRKRLFEAVENMVDAQCGKYSLEVRVRRPDGSVIWLASRGKYFFDSSVQSHMIVGTVFNLSDMNQVRETLEKSGTRNEITNLPVRGRLLLDTEKVIHDRNVLSAALILVDVKGFHTYNDRFGRTAGDEIIRSLSTMLIERLPSGGKLFHIGIDVFCILWPHASRVQVESFMEYMQEEMANPLFFEKEVIYFALSMSAALFPACGTSADELLVNAEITLHKVKQEARKRYAIFAPSDKRELKERLDFEFLLSKSIRNSREGFLLYYQPLVSPDGSEVIGAEALLRWLAPTKEVINPEKVIAGLEATGHMEDIGAWILEQGICQCSEWLDAGVRSDFLIHINITAEDLMRPDYSSCVISLLNKYSMSPGNVILEITETSLMRNIATCRQNLIRLRNEGIKISLDDFGTGYSSLNYLKELPVDEIKIDRSFIEDIQNDLFNHSFINAIVILAHSISRKVCVEGIENDGQAIAVEKLGADACQGFYFGRPMSAGEFETKYFKKGGRRI